MKLQKKALRLSAFFIGLGISVAASAAGCLPSGARQTISITQVIDGDTVRDEKGQLYRFAAINTPELDHKTGRHQPYALEAKEAVIAWLSENPTPQWVSAQDSKDRYGRELGYLVSADQSLAEALVGAGLAWAVAIAPNTELAECLVSVEARPRVARLGVWMDTPVSADTISSGGFAVIEGRVTHIEQTRKDYYIDIDDHLVIRIERSLYEQSSTTRSLKLDDRIEARGWIIDRRASLKPGSTFKGFVLTLSALEGFQRAN